MNYILNEIGEVKVTNERNEEKYFPVHIAEDSHMMRVQGWRIVEAPKKFEPIAEKTDSVAPISDNTNDVKDSKTKK